MKNIYILIIAVVAISITSCTALKSDNKEKSDHTVISKERMQIDAYAMANIECEYKLMHVKLEDTKGDINLIGDFNEMKSNIVTFSKFMNTRYGGPDGLSPEFNKMVKSAQKELTVCKQLKAIEDSRLEEKSDLEKK